MEDTQRLVVSLEARLTKYEKDMARAGKATNDNFQKMERRSTRFSQNMVKSTGRVNTALASTAARVGSLSKLSGFNVFTAGAVAALAPVLSISAALMKARDAVTSFDKIAKNAKATGLDSDFYQGLIHGADLAGVGVDELNAGMVAFIRNSGLAAVGQGELAGKLKELNPELLKQLQSAKTQEERFRLVADAVKAVTSETQKAAIASAAFGRNGARMVELLKDGADGLDAMATEARRLGLVIDRDVLAKSEAMNDQLSIATRIMDAEFKKALVDLAPVLVSTARLAADVAGAIRQIVDAMKGLETKSKAGLLEMLAEKEANLKKAETSSVAGFILSGADGEGLDRLKGEIAGIKAELKSRAIDELRGGLNRQTAELQRKPDDIPDTGNGRSTSRNKAAEAALREAAAVTDLITDLQAERNEIGMSDVERDKSRTLRRAGTGATAEQRQEIGRLIEAINVEKEAQQQAADTAAFFKDSTYQAFTDLIPTIETGNAALDGFINRLIEAVAQAALLGEGPLAGMFGGTGAGIIGALFGFAGGGYTGDGDKNQPAGIVHRGEFVMSKRATKNIGIDRLTALHGSALRGFADGGYVGTAPSILKPDFQPANQNVAQTISISAPITIEGSAGTPDQNDDLAKKMQRELEGTMRGVVADELRVQMRPGNMLNNGKR
ncbi:hypothetical protein IMCC20628_02740 [Hoeflea sp. IMCC20628]|uniref:hypothetical protein n=1 Tax=Hoeflea sp. IMCC20628 TaxID=1620421 RepID=UPI00063AE3D3|nr:hypothetical protein [Hoeflea sp. IMCC20628]AKI01436.1 hypothetical protein IMCC20628_02740 [Hoeflea sp. IMCC20628]